jgi:hypothetical protein
VSLTIPLINYDIQINFGWIIIGMFAVLLILGKITSSTPIAIAVALVGAVWLTMLNSSRTLLSNIMQSLHPSALYIELIVMVLILIFVIITIVDYITGQRSG